MTINPNSDRDYVDQVDIAIPHNYPKFFNAVRFDVFRHIKNLALEFKSPITRLFSYMQQFCKIFFLWLQIVFANTLNIRE